MIPAVRETVTALKIWPEARHWRTSLSVGLPALALVAGLGLLGGWLSWAPVTDGKAMAIAVVLLFFLPAFVEEFFFRGVLLSWLAARWNRWAAWISTLLFVLWHPLQALTIGPPWAELFLAPTFWIATLIWGVVLSHIRIVTKSLWPVILTHWIAVVIWKSLLGGPFY